jgi:hypothetical protein
MKKVLAIVLAVFLIAALTPIALAADTTVTVSVSVDGKLEVAAQPVTVSGDPTVDGVLKAAHAKYFTGGEGGYAAGIDKTWNMFLITKCWGVTTTPYVIVNNAPLGSNQALPSTADVATVATGDNLVICISSDQTKPPQPVSLSAVTADGNTTVTATLWTLDMATFKYSSAPMANAKVVDPATGAELGSTDATGTVVVPATGVAAIDGLAAIPVDGTATVASADAGAAAPAAAAPAPATSEEGVTVYVTVSLDGVLQIAGQPVTVNTLTAEAALKAAHAAYCPKGEAGFAAGIDATYGMYMINTVWGVKSTPYVVVNSAPLGAGDNSNYISADVAPVKAGDNIVVVISSAGATFPVVSWAKDDKGAISVQNWVLDFTTFKYSNAPMPEGTEIVDAQTGDVLGKTDALGKVTIKNPPASGVIAVAGLSAYVIGENVQPFTCITTVYTPPKHDYSVFGGPDGKSLRNIVIVGVGLAIPLGAVVLHAQRKELKNHGVKFVNIDKALKKKR